MCVSGSDFQYVVCSLTLHWCYLYLSQLRVGRSMSAFHNVTSYVSKWPRRHTSGTMRRMCSRERSHLRRRNSRLYCTLYLPIDWSCLELLQPGAVGGIRPTTFRDHVTALRVTSRYIASGPQRCLCFIASAQLCSHHEQRRSSPHRHSP